MPPDPPSISMLRMLIVLHTPPLCKILDPPPSHNYFGRVEIPALYSKVKSGMQQQINHQCFVYYAGTTDLWSSITSKPFLSYTMYDMDKNGLCALSPSKHVICLKLTLTSIYALTKFITNFITCTNFTLLHHLH